MVYRAAQSLAEYPQHDLNLTKKTAQVIDHAISTTNISLPLTRTRNMICVAAIEQKNTSLYLVL